MTPFLAKELVKIGYIEYFVNFWQLLGQTGGQMLTNLNFKARFQILS